MRSWKLLEKPEGKQGADPENSERTESFDREALTEESAESRKDRLEKIRELTERLVAASGADA